MIEYKESEFYDEFYKELARQSPSISEKIKKKSVELLNQSPTYQSLKDGDLKRLLFIDNVDFIEKWVSDQVNFFPNKNTLLNFIDEDYKGLLDNSASSFSTRNGKVVNWLYHLLFSGSVPLFRLGKLIKTNQGIYLVKDSNDFVFSVDDSGIPDNNFITRAMSPMINILPRLL